MKLLGLILIFLGIIQCEFAWHGADKDKSTRQEMLAGAKAGDYPAAKARHDFLVRRGTYWGAQVPMGLTILRFFGALAMGSLGARLLLRH